MLKTEKIPRHLQLITVLRLEVRRVFSRIKDRKIEYIQHFASHRTREHFNEVFKHRFDKVSLSDLSLCTEEVVMGLDNFFCQVDELRWYLLVTEDMPARVEDYINKEVKAIESSYALLNLYIEAEIESLRPGNQNKLIPPQIADK